MKRTKDNLQSQVLLVLEELYRDLSTPKSYSVSGLLKRMSFQSYIFKALLDTKIIKIVKKEGLHKVCVWANKDILPNAGNATLVANRTRDLIKGNKNKTIEPIGRKKLYDLDDIALIKELIRRDTPMAKAMLSKGADAMRSFIKDVEDMIHI